MSRSTNETQDIMNWEDHMDSPSIDEGSWGESSGAEPVMKKGPWTPEEDAILVDYVKRNGEGNWNAVQKNSVLLRCGKSCRLRWANHLRPNLKKGSFTTDEEKLIIELHARMGNKWARMAAHLPGRTDNEIKNYWNTRIKRCHRAGLPLYPPDVYLQAMNKNHLKQKTCCDIQGVVFDKADPDAILQVSTLPDIPITSLLTQEPVLSQSNSFIPQVMQFSKRLRESENLFTGFSGSTAIGTPQLHQFDNKSRDKIHPFFRACSPPDDDLDIEYSPSFAPRPGRQHALLNENSSASKPVTRAVKLELPSLQYPETDLGSWWMLLPSPSIEYLDAFIQSPRHTR